MCILTKKRLFLQGKRQKDVVPPRLWRGKQQKAVLFLCKFQNLQKLKKRKNNTCILKKNVV